MTTVDAVTMGGPENGGTSRRTVSKHKAVKEEPLLDIAREGEAESWGLDLTEGRKYPHQTEPHKGRTVRTRK